MEIKNLKKTYGDKIICDGLNLKLPDEGVITILGRSGIGKTTFVHMIAGLVKPDDGEIIFTEGKNRISMVFQENRLLDNLSVLDNVLLAQSEGLDGKEIIKDLGLENDMNTKVHDLSGGMARRCAIARCLARKADIYIMDEPIKGLDKDTAALVIDTIVERCRGSLLLVVTHNKEEFIHADMEITIE